MTYLNQSVIFFFHSFFLKETSGDVLDCLKNLLNSGDNQSHWISMSLLHSVMKHCNKDIYEDNALLWFKQTLKLLNSIPSESLIGLCLENLNIIILKSLSVEKISRELSTKGLDPFLQLITGSVLF